MNAVMLLYLGGILHLFFLVFHLFFWRLFKWRKELRSLSAINKAVMPVMNICLMVIFLTNALISFFYQGELLTTSLGSAVLLSVSLFWFTRTVLQLIYFDNKKPISILLTVVFVIMFIIYLIPVAG